MSKISNPRRTIFSALLLCGCSWATLACLYYQGYEGSWYRIQDVMEFSAHPPFQHRILFVLLALWVKAAIPALGYRGCFFVSQVVPIFLLFRAAEEWAALYVPRHLAFIGQLLCVAALVPTIRYYTFYDFGTVFFFTASLSCLVQGRFARYLVYLVLGTLNHEIVVLLVPVYFVMNWNSRSGKGRVLGRTLLQFALYSGVRVLLFYFLPATAAWRTGKMIFNLNLLLHHPRQLVECALTIGIWYGVALLGIPHAPRELRRSLILLPLVLVVTFLFGQFNEPRNFNAFLPVAIGLILCAIRPESPSSAIAEGGSTGLAVTRGPV